MMNHDIFISYSSKQKSIADGVCHYLEENGFKCWMAPRDIPVGNEYDDLIMEAIMSCNCVVLVFSETASKSRYVKAEINIAFAKGKPILPLRVDETEIEGGFMLKLNQFHWIDAFPHYADRLPDLLNSVCGFLGRQPHKVSDDNERLEAEREAEEAKRKARQERRECERAEVQRRAEMEGVNRLKVSDNPQPKPKKGLWIGFGAAVVVALLLLLLWPIKEKQQSKEQLQTQQIASQNTPTVSNDNSPSSSNNNSIGTANGHEWVDLGLPSGTLWATCNVGANSPEGYGSYFAWGETTTKTIYNKKTYKYYKYDKRIYDDTRVIKYCNNSGFGYDGFIDNLTVLQAEDDVATSSWGIDWCMPTKEQWQELLQYTTHTWTMQNNVVGRVFTAKNGNSIFLPAAGADGELGVGEYGEFWSNSIRIDAAFLSWGLLFDSDGCEITYFYRDSGFSVRPVRSAE